MENKIIKQSLAKYKETPTLEYRRLVWPCPTCGAVGMEDAGDKCKADCVCSAEDQRQLDYEREQSTPNALADLRRKENDGHEEKRG